MVYVHTRDENVRAGKGQDGSFGRVGKQKRASGERGEQVDGQGMMVEEGVPLDAGVVECPLVS